MTGGQLAPRSSVSTTSTPTGRDARLNGYPIPITEMLALCPGTARRAIRCHARVDRQDQGHASQGVRGADRGPRIGIVEVLSNCPVGWGMTPVARSPISRPSRRRIRSASSSTGAGRLRWRPHSSSRGSADRASCWHTCSPTPQWSRAAKSHGSRPTGRRCAAGRLAARSSSATSDRFARRGPARRAGGAHDAVAREAWPAARCSLLVVDSALVSVGPRPGVEIVDIPCTQLARAAGSDKLVSIVALGAVLATRSGLGSGGARGARRDRRREASGAPSQPT